ncbi:hypothetical protein HFO10_00705 [Rhizobium laguerreae]|uniref:hypothetical protein n=1 Tax=Rhizobium laguerreae TaxID=1076926 RepID=UPI001C91E774|nr:hypothetical protein [Rhizobium laguerreae]MBY3294492.1 hypothetical protein [Rhizobium laguerreae]
MHVQFPFSDDSFKLGSVKTYQKAVRLMRETWEAVLGEPLKLHSAQPLAQFTEALERFSVVMKRSKSQATQLENSLQSRASEDPALEDLLNETLVATPEARSALIARDMDNIPPRLCLDAIWAVAIEKAAGDEVTIPLDDFLRAVMVRVAKEMNWSVPLRVGQNRHFARAWQWLCEVSESSWIDEGYGIRILNTRGPIPAWPQGPGDLRVRIDPSKL